MIVKANNSSQGRGIFIADVDTKEKIDTVFEKILKIFKERSTVVVEQCIKQNNKMGKFHPGSVNTVRIATFIKDDGVDILFSFFRMGRNNSEVDNAGAGGY